MSRSALLKDPIFIVGNIHSGTTLLKSVLSRSPFLYSIPKETSFFFFLPRIKSAYHDISTNNKSLKDYINYLYNIVLFGDSVTNTYDKHKRTFKLNQNVPEKYFNEIITFITNNKPDLTHEILYRAFIDILCKETDHLRWVEKSPSNLYSIEHIMSNYSDAKVLIMVRDPRDILASRKTRWRNLKGKEYILLKDIIEWKLSQRTIEKVKNNPNILVLSYEQLIYNPEKTVQYACKFLHLKYQNKMINISQINTANNYKITTSGFSDKEINKYKNILTKYEIMIAQLLLKPEMKQSKYQKTKISKFYLFIVPFILLNQLIKVGIYYIKKKSKINLSMLIRNKSKRES